MNRIPLRSALVTALLVATVLLASIDDASAQRRWYWGGRAYYGPGWWGGWGGGTSAVGDARRGAAAMIRARGEYAERAARARLDYEKAREKYIENRKLFIQHELERKKMGREARKEYYAEKAAARERRKPYFERQAAKAGLVATQYDPDTGRINWPKALESATFAEEREEISELMLLNAHAGVSANVSNEVLALASEMESNLKRQINDLPPHEYIEARQFLKGLKEEVAQSL